MSVCVFTSLLFYFPESYEGCAGRADRCALDAANDFLLDLWNFSGSPSVRKLPDAGDIGAWAPLRRQSERGTGTTMCTDPCVPGAQLGWGASCEAWNTE